MAVFLATWLREHTKRSRKTWGSLATCEDPGGFAEWGSALGVITIMADLLGFEACGIELDAALVRTARGLAARYESRARFAVGSFLTGGYAWKPRSGDGRLATIGEGTPGYASSGTRWKISTWCSGSPGAARSR